MTGIGTGTQGTTNTKANSCQEVQLNCDAMWSLCQQWAYARLCLTSDLHKENHLLYAYSDRARRIAATYARFYLETEDNGKPRLKGRYYWMGLAAFASKTVACSLDDTRVATLPTVFNGLAKGNFWLFMDIAPWHRYWSWMPGSFDMCEAQRDANSCVPQVKKVLNDLPWAAEALPKIGNLKSQPFIHKGMSLVRKIEREVNADARGELQMQHLLAIANHEQKIILQPLIYDDDDFADWLKVQRSPWVNWASPTLKLAFSSACDASDERLESVAPKDTVLENFKSRMDWIKSAAVLYHRLMQGVAWYSDSASYMEGELKKIAGWVTSADERYTPTSFPPPY